MVKILSIETSCDETAAAVITDASCPSERILSNVIFSQIQEHIDYGGVVPELAARAHLHHMKRVVSEACQMARVTLHDIDAIAVTAGPGLIGGVLIGVTVAKAMAMAANKPIIAVNHLEGHALTPRLSDDVPYPYLLLLVSGGHCQFVAVLGLGHYVLLGQTLDDSAGEAFDKVAKMMDAGYPGGPAVEQLASAGDPLAYTLPRPLLGRADANLSFSGLKTAMREHIQRAQQGEAPDQEATKANLCASFQKAVADHLCDKMIKAIALMPVAFSHIVVAGGVAANQFICAQIRKIAQKNNKQFIAPPLRLCTDNAAMIGWAGIEHMKAGHVSDLGFSPRPRWPLSDVQYKLDQF